MIVRITNVKKDNKIHIPAKKITPNEQGVVKLTPAAMKALTDVVNESGRSMREIASLIILQAIENDLIIYDRED